MQHLATNVTLHTTSTGGTHRQRFLFAVSRQLEPQTLPLTHGQWSPRPCSSLGTQLERCERTVVTLCRFNTAAGSASGKSLHPWPHSPSSRNLSRQQGCGPAIAYEWALQFTAGSGKRQLCHASINESSRNSSEGQDAAVSGEAAGGERFVVLNFYHLTRLEDPHATVAQHRAFVEVGETLRQTQDGRWMDSRMSW